MNKNGNKWVILSLVICAILLIGGLLARFLIDWETFPYYGHMLSGWMMPFGMVGMIAFWLMVILLVSRTIGSRKMNGCCSHGSEEDESAIRTLKERLAKGEISIEEYETILKRIKEVQ